MAGPPAVNVFVADEQGEPVDLEATRRLVEHVLRAEKVPESTELAVVFVDAEQIARYNESFMDRPGPTDVLAFPLESLEPGRAPQTSPGGPPVGLGDVFVCPAVVARNAKRDRVSPEDEMALVVVHGILHLLGYDHDDDEEADVMESRERELLAAVGRRRP